MSTFPREGDTFGRYRILGQLGHGAMGVVFRALQADLNREVALKVLPPQHAEEIEFRERFKREASILASVDSPHIINIFDHGEQDGCLFIVTQLVKGGDLGQVLRSDGPMPVSTALDLLAQLAGGLADAHEAGVVHRDVKPSNVLLRQTGDGVHAYLCDFGIARADEEGLTQAGVVVGSYAFMAPERLMGDAATHQSDLYSLGCLLVTSLTGQLPYAGTDMQVAQQHVSGPIPQWEETTPVMASLNAVLRRSMAKNLDERYQSAREMRDDLLAARDLVRHAQVPAPVEHTVHRASLPPARAGLVTSPIAPIRRRRTRWVAAGAGVAALVALVGGVAWAVRSDDTRDTATKGSSANSSTKSSGQPSAAPSATIDPPRQSQPAATCWDGTAVAESGRCSEPTGLAGLRWVFPSLDRQWGECEPGDHNDGKLMERACTQRLSDGDIVSITYSEWDEWGDARAHYEDDVFAGLTPRRHRKALSLGPLWSKDETRVRSSILYAGEHAFSATVIGKTEEAVRQGIDLVRFRPPQAFNR